MISLLHGTATFATITPAEWAGIVVIILFFIITLALIAQVGGLFLQCIVTGARVKLTELFFMRFRKVNPTIIVRSMIMSVQSGLTKTYPITAQKLEAH